MTCRNCKKELNNCFIDLGSSPPSNSYLIKSQLNSIEKYYPLQVYICNYCWLAQVIDYAGTADTNNITIGRNSHKIQGDAADLTVSTERAAFTLVYVNATQGWLLDSK